MVSAGRERTSRFDVQVISGKCDAFFLAQGLAAILRLAEAITLINQTIQRVETNGDVLYVMCQSYSA
jgi:hypothetical protein